MPRSIKEKGEIIGDVPLETVIKVARVKMGKMRSKTLKEAAKEVLGTCLSIGVTCNGKDPREVIREIDAGAHDTLFSRD